MQIDFHIFQAIKLKSMWCTGPCRSQAGSGGSALFPKRRRFPFWDRFSIFKTTPTYFRRKCLSSEGDCTISEAAVLAGVLLGTSRKDIFPLCEFKSQIVCQRDKLLRPRRCCRHWTTFALEYPKLSITSAWSCRKGSGWKHSAPSHRGQFLHPKCFTYSRKEKSRPCWHCQRAPASPAIWDGTVPLTSLPDSSIAHQCLENKPGPWGKNSTESAKKLGGSLFVPAATSS